MSTKLLVTYASKYGATREIAERVGYVLRQAGLDVDIRPVADVRDVDPYQAVILGSAVYIGKWMKSACEFMKKYEVSLAARPVWLFSSGPTGQGDPVDLLDGWQLPADQKPLIDHIQPREIVVFHGNIDAARVNLIEKTAVQALKKPFGDFRDWDAINSWSLSIAESLKGAEPLPLRS
jgi:menaquinone-dependent protoporphyrinogen oxidase